MATPRTDLALIEAELAELCTQRDAWLGIWNEAERAGDTRRAQVAAFWYRWYRDRADGYLVARARLIERMERNDEN